MSHDSDPLREQVEPCREILKHPVRLGAYPGQGCGSRAVLDRCPHGSQTATLAGHRLSPGESERGRGPDPSVPRAVGERGSDQGVQATHRTGADPCPLVPRNASTALAGDDRGRDSGAHDPDTPTAVPGYPRPSQGAHSHGPLRGVQHMAGRPDGPPPRLGGSFTSGHVVSAVAAVRASIAHPPALANGDSRYQAPATRSMQ